MTDVINILKFNVRIRNDYNSNNYRHVNTKYVITKNNKKTSESFVTIHFVFKK